MESSIITIKIGKNNVDFTFTANKFDWQLYCKNDRIEFNGSVCNGYYSQDKRSAISLNFQREFLFFKEELLVKINKELLKLKLIEK